MTSSKAENNSFVLVGNEKITYEDRPIPQIKDAKDVKLQVNFTGICGSDVHFWHEGKMGEFVVKSPMVLGHESAGTVVEVGSGVKGLQVGDRVSMEPGVPCRTCVICREGRYNLCEDMQFAATPPIDGTLAKYYVLPEDFCNKLPEHVSTEEGALVEPLSVAVHCISRTKLKYGDKVVVFGAGPVGLLCCAVAKTLGASKVIAVDINPARLKFAREFAASGTYESQRISAEENAANIRQQNDLGIGADVAIDASGAEPSIQTAMYLLRRGGSYVQTGMARGNVSFPITDVCIKEINVSGSFRYGPGDYATALNMIASGKINVKPLISRRVAFNDAEQAFKDFQTGKAIKILIEGP